MKRRMVKGQLYELVENPTGKMGCGGCPFQDDDIACCEAGYDCLTCNVGPNGELKPVIWSPVNENA